MNNKSILDYNSLLITYKNKAIIIKDESIRRFFPILSSTPVAEEYAYIIGKVMGDGNLDPSFTMRFIGKHEDLLLLQNYILNTFKLNPSRFSIRQRKSKGISYLLQINCAFFGRILFLLGAPIGNKMQNPFSIPPWILANKSCKRRFLQALLEDELTTIKIEKCSYSVNPRLKMAKRGDLIGSHLFFMNQVKEAIDSFGVKCSRVSKPINCKSSFDLYFHIMRNKKNILKFKKEIGFRFNQNKIQKLEECCKVIANSLECELGTK
jgi:hypothetical protein